MTRAAKSIWLLVGIVVIFVALWALQILIVKLGWNHGVVPTAKRAGGTVGSVSFWGAFWLSWALSIARGDMFHAMQAQKLAKAIENLGKK